MCDCVTKFNVKLAERNTVLSEGILVNFETRKSRQTLIIQTEKIGKSRSKALFVYPTFCPFCGERIQTTLDEQLPAQQVAT